MPIYQRGQTTGSITLPDGRNIERVYVNGDLVFGELAVAPTPVRGGGLVPIEDGAVLVSTALGGDAGGGTAGDREVSVGVFGSRYPSYGGQSVGPGATFNMAALTYGGHFGTGSSTTLAQFNANNTITTTFPEGNGDPATNGSGFNNEMGLSGEAPTVGGVYDINIDLDNADGTGFYQLVVQPATGTHETPVNLVTSGTVTIFQNGFIFGTRTGNTQGFTLGPATADTSADCFIALNLPPDINTVGITLEPDTSTVAFGYAAFSGQIQWFGFRGVPSEMGTATHTLTVNGVASDMGPPLISEFTGRITGPTTGSTDTTVSVTFTIGAIGGSAITEVAFNGNALDEPAEGWMIGEYTFNNVPARTRADGGVSSQMTITNSDGTFTTTRVTLV